MPGIEKELISFLFILGPRTMLRIHFVSPKVSSGYPRIIKKENRKLDEAAPKGDHEVIEQRSPPPTSCYKFLFLFLYISLVPD
jgi:hypothetical protein